MPTIHREFAFAKLTRTLRVTGRRDDGYHLLESEMVTLDLADELELTDGDSFEVIDALQFVGEHPRSRPALDVPSDQSNLVCKALALAGLKKSVRLTKRVPPGGGLGGGSADAAAVMRFAGISDPRLVVALGADVPFCLRGGRALVRGIGEVLEPLAFESLSYVLLTPDFGVSTKAVYEAFDDLAGRIGLASGSNDLEPAALLVEPRLQSCLDLLAQATGLEPALAGSGSTLFVECPADAVEDLRASTRDAVLASGRRALVIGAHTVPAQFVPTGDEARDRIER